MERWFPLRTARLLLREIGPADIPAIHEYAGDPEVVRYMQWGPNDLATTVEVTRDWLDEQQRWPRDSVQLAIEPAGEAKIAGAIHLWVSDAHNATGSFGFVLNRAYWGRGYATEAARAVMDCAFREVGLHRLCATCDTRNLASAHVLEKLGMRREAEHRKDVLQKMEWRDSYLYAILREEWK
jgi:[ribosomal protein S5]-alanine N-acetyltransferase